MATRHSWSGLLGSAASGGDQASWRPVNTSLVSCWLHCFVIITNVPSFAGRLLRRRLSFVRLCVCVLLAVTYRYDTLSRDEIWTLRFSPLRYERPRVWVCDIYTRCVITVPLLFRHNSYVYITVYLLTQCVVVVKKNYYNLNATNIK